MALSSGLGLDLGTTGGKWLFKQGELLLGPVPFGKLVELLYAGEVAADTPIAQVSDEPRFKPLESYEAFRVHLAKAQAKLRVEAQSVERKKTMRRGRLLKLVSFGLLTIALVLGGGKLAIWLAIDQPWKKKYVMPEPVITEELPQIKLASAREEVELDYPDAVAPGGKPAPGRPARPARPKPGAGSAPSAAAKAGPSGPGGGETDPDGLHSSQNWDQQAIHQVVNSSKKTLHRCLSDEARRQKPGWAARIPIEFTIGNDGRITKLWIDNPDYKSEATDLFKCMLGELRKWKFPAYDGEQANFSLAFNIQARSN